jgi:hypothetical protein
MIKMGYAHIFTRVIRRWRSSYAVLAASETICYLVIRTELRFGCTTRIVFQEIRLTD